MLKKVRAMFLIFLLATTLIGCSDNKKEDTKKTQTNNKPVEEKKPREFTESTGTIKYFTINGENIAIPETVGEYVRYLEKYGEVTLGDTGKSISDVPDMEANQIASLASYLRVAQENGEYQWFGIHYFNPSDETIPVADAKVDRITLTYDVYAELPEYQQIKTIVLVSPAGEMPINGVTTSKKIINIMGNPVQNTDGYLKYNDESGFTYKFATENKKGILTQIQIDYPKQ